MAKVSLLSFSETWQPRVWTMGQWKMVARCDLSCLFLHHVDGFVHLRCIPGEHMGPGCTMGRGQTSSGSAMLWAMFCWETSGPAIHVDVTLTCTTWLSIVADHVHPFMEAVFPDGCGLFQQDNEPQNNNGSGWFEELNNEFEMLTWPPNSPDLNQIKHLWDVLDKPVRSMAAPPHNLQDLKDLLLTSWCQIPQHTLRDLVESMFRRVSAVLAAKGDQYNIRLVVIMLCLIVYINNRPLIGFLNQLLSLFTYEIQFTCEFIKI